MSAFELGPNISDVAGTTLPTKAVSDADGAAALWVFPSPSVSIRATTDTPLRTQTQIVNASADTSITFTLPGDYVLFSGVVRLGSGDPVVGALVEVADANATESALTDSSGAFSFMAPAGAAETVGVYGSVDGSVGYGAVTSTGALPRSFIVRGKIDLQTDTVQDLTLPTAVKVDAQVKDTSGAPVEGARLDGYVEASMSAFELGPNISDVAGTTLPTKAVSDADGAAALWVFPSPSVSIRATTDTPLRTQTQIVNASADTSITFTLPTAPSAPASSTAQPGDGQVDVSWAAPVNDGGSPITGYLVSAYPSQTALAQVSGSAQTLRAGLSSSAAAAAPQAIQVSTGPDARSATLAGLTNGVTYTVTVEAVNAVATGPPATSTVTPGAQAVTVQENDPSVAIGGWRGANDTTATGGTYRSSASFGDIASFKFAGPTITWLTRQGPDQGVAAIFIDGVSKGTVDLWSAVQANISKTYGGLARRTHTIKVIALSRVGGATTLDGFQVGGKFIDDTSLSVAYDAWVPAKSTKASGGTYISAATSSSFVSFDFRGRSVDLTTATGPNYGKAQIFIDGISQGVVDLFSTRQQWRVVKSFGGLAPGAHTIKVSVLGAKNPSSHGKNVVVDAFTAHS